MQEPLHRFSHEAMTTFFEVFIAGREEKVAAAAARAFFDEIDRIEGLLSRFDPASDISQINRLIPGERARVSHETMECLLIALWVATETEGAFDPTVGPLVDLWSPLRRPLQDGGSFSLQPDPEILSQRLARVGLTRLALDADKMIVGIAPDERDEKGEMGIALDLGAIGKGYALDKASDLLEDWDIANALLDAGTSTVLALGSADGDPLGSGWPVSVGGRWGDAAGLAPVWLRDEALSGSGTEVKGPHILDPRTGRPAEGHLAAWVVAPSAAVTDALSTAFMVMATEEVQSFCEGHTDIRGLLAQSRPLERLLDCPPGRLMRVTSTTESLQDADS